MSAPSALRALALAGGLLLSSALPATSQQSELARVRAAFPGEAGDRIVALIEEGREEGLPPALLVNKALEGAQKNAPPDQVVKAVAEYARELRRARAAVGGDVGDEALKEAADALRRGVPAPAIRSLARSANGDLSILFVVMFDLMDQGVPAAPAEALVEDAVRRGVAGDRLLSVPASVRQLIRDGLAPADAADSVRRRIGGGQSFLPAPPWRWDPGGPRPGRWGNAPPALGTAWP